MKKTKTSYFLDGALQDVIMLIKALSLSPPPLLHIIVMIIIHITLN